MEANTKPIFPLTPNVGFKVLITADTSLSTPTTAGQVLLTAGPNGTKIDAIKVRAIDQHTQSVLRIFINDGQGLAASNFALVYEVKLPAVSAISQTDVTQAQDIVLLPINYDSQGNGQIPPYLKAGQKLYVSCGVSAMVMVTAFGGDY